MSIADKLTRLNTTKQDIKNAIEAKGGDLTNKTFENDYAAEISEIETVITGQQKLTGFATESVAAFDTVSVESIYKYIERLEYTGPIPPNAPRGLSITNDGIYVALNHLNSPFLAIYKRSGDIFNKLPDPSFVPTSANQVSFSPDSIYLAVALDVSPFIVIYKRSGDTFTKLANPSILPPGNALSVDFSNDGNYVVVGHFNSPFITIYKRSGDTFTKLANPNILPTGSSANLKFSPDNTYLAVSHLNSPFLTIYKRNNDTFTKLPDVPIPPGGGFSTVQGLEFSNNNDYLVFYVDSTKLLFVYKRNGDVFTKITEINTFNSSGTVGALKFTSNDLYLLVGQGTNPFFKIYKRDGDNFNVIPGSLETLLPSNAGRGIVLSGDDVYMVIANDTGTRISFYKTDSTEDWTDLNHFIQKTNNTFLERYDLIANRRIFHLGYTNESGNTNDEIEFTSLLRRGV